MRKKVVATSVIGFIFMVAGLVFFPLIGNFINGGAIFNLNGILNNSGNPMATIQNLVIGSLTKGAPMGFVALGVAALFLIFAIVVLIQAIRKRHGAAAWAFIAVLLEAVVLYAFLLLAFVPGYYAQYGQSMYAYNGLAVTDQFPGFYGWIFAVGNQAGNIGLAILALVPTIVFVTGFILALIAVIGEMRYLASLDRPEKAPEVSNDEVFVLDDDDLEDEDKAEKAAANLERQGGYQERRPEPLPAAPGIQGPLLVQYINTYAPAGEQQVRNQKGNVPLSEIQSNITGEKPLTAEDIRKIIAEELAEKKEPAPVIVSVPAPEKPAEPQPAASAEKPLTAEDVRNIFSEELGRYLAQDEDGYQDGDIVVEEEPEPILTAADIRSIIAEELAAAKPAIEEEPAPAQPEEKAPEAKPENVRDAIREELAAYQAAREAEARAKEEQAAAAKAREEELASARAEAAEAARKEVEEKYQTAKAEEEAPKPMTAEDIRSIIAEELAKAPAEEKKEEVGITAEMIREIIRSELKDATPVKEEKVVPVTVVVKEKEEVVQPEPQPEPAPEPEPVVVPVVAPVAAPARAVGEVNPDLPPHDKIIRIPFPTRMVEGEKDLKSNYNELKSEIMSYGVKSRVSNSGDTFRLHKVTFVKITVAGKGLKLYFALNPKDYANSTLPVQDAGHKGTYRDIPLVFKVKSKLSVRRAKQLISDVMEKNGIEQGKIEPHNWAEELKDYKPAGSDKDDDE
ncbi:MAG: APC family permease [Bacilli bacterium]|nr:APC family permease [Bacilli bacterium]